MTATIASEAEARVMLGLTTSISEEERAIMNLLLPAAAGRVVQHIGYDPVQRSATEYYPRFDPTGGIGMPDTIWDVDAGHRQARMYYQRGGGTLYPTLQLERLPVRVVSSVHVDYDAKHGAGPDAFDGATLWTQGSDYWPEWDEDNYCRTGCLFGRSRWPLEPGTVKVVYTAGYSPDELNGRVSTTGRDGDGYYNRIGVDASPIKRAVLLNFVAAMHKWAALKKSSTTGWTPGPMQSERLQDYQYTLGGNAGATIAGLAVEMTGASIDLCEPFRHWGRLRL